MRTLRLLPLFLLFWPPNIAEAKTAEHYAKLFEAIRADLPCMDNVAAIAQKHRFRPTSNDDKADGYSSAEYSDSGGRTYILTSHEVRNGEQQNAASVSIYEVDHTFPADLTNAFADLWDLPAPEPLRTDASLAQFDWNISFPNGPMQIIVSYNPNSKLAQIYGRTLDLRKDQLDGCSR